MRARRPRASREDAASGAEWVGVALRLGGEAFLLAREETREVMGYPPGDTGAGREELDPWPRPMCAASCCR